jgi:hypothetical protein
MVLAGPTGGSVVLSVSPVLLLLVIGVPPAWLPDEPSVVDLASSSAELPFTLASGVGAVGAGVA